ncbi:MAG: DUF839 domain-containing protein [Burkholderiales bacterium]|nr:DUF839 domain-containing protein [Burkholderiales bacterium]
MRRRLKQLALSVIATTSLAPMLASGDDDKDYFGKDRNEDFGMFVERKLNNRSKQLFGVKEPLNESAPETTGAYRTATQKAEAQVLLADGLHVEYLTRNAGNETDMMDFFPLHKPTHLITCVEGAREQLTGDADKTKYAAGDKFNPAVQRISLSDGKVETILRGMTRCDGIRTTPWGTILITEETTDGGAYEILNPLKTTNFTVFDRATGVIVDTDGKENAVEIAKRAALPTMAWEGIAVLASGVVIAGDELRPGSIDLDGDKKPENDTDGGAIFKFVPQVPRSGDGLITALAQSPFASGAVHALQVSCQDNIQQYGQGCEIGNAAWISVNAATARTDANKNGATGYYRPEDLHDDPLYKDAENALAVRVCWTNTGNEDGKNYAEVVCAVDSEPLIADPTKRTVVANRFVEGDTDFNSFDNLAFQPKTGNLYVIEDHDNGDIFACLRDGEDRDIKSDGCVKILSVKDSSAEPTGFIFAPDGETAYLSIQHSDDTNAGAVGKFDGYATDDLLKITGFKIRKGH